MRVEELEHELRAERAEPDPGFARRLDEWAAAGFPREREPGVLERLRGRLTAAPPRRMLLRAGAVATVVVVAGVGISRVDLSPENHGQGLALDRTTAGGAEKSPPAAEFPSTQPPVQTSGGAAESTAPLELDQAQSAPGTVESVPPPAHRKIAQRVDLALSTAPADFRDAADGVLDVVADHRGFVVSSTVSGGDPSVRGAQPGNANFRLKIPTRELPTALAALSDLGHVVSRTDGTEDITGRFVGAKQRIAELTQTRRNLLAQLEDAVTETEQQSIRARLRYVAAQLEDASGDLAAAQQRVSLVPVSVSIAADPEIAKGGGSDGGGWSLSDALHDARDVLTVLAGIALVSLAVLVPLGLVGLLLWWAALRIQRQRREAALD